jgi:hypothetical protein
MGECRRRGLLDGARRLGKRQRSDGLASARRETQEVARRSAGARKVLLHQKLARRAIPRTGGVHFLKNNPMQSRVIRVARYVNTASEQVQTLYDAVVKGARRNDGLGVQLPLNQL